MRLDQLPRSDNVEDRRGEDGGAGFRIPGGRGGLGIGTIIVLGLVGYWLGIDPSVLIGGAEILTGGGSSQQQTNPAPRDSAGAQDTGAPSDQMGQFVSAVLGGTETQWQKIFAQYGKVYEPPTLVMFSGVTRSACGFAQSAMGPFYCPNDRKVYLDTSFFQDLERRFRACDAGSKSCQFSQAYVISHEVGHHVQNLLGILPKVQRAVATAGAGLCGARRFHPRHFATAHPLVHDRAEVGEGRELRHVQRGTALSARRLIKDRSSTRNNRGRSSCGTSSG